MKRAFMVISLAVLLIAALFVPAQGTPHRISSHTIRAYYTPDHYPSFQEINHTLHQIANEHPDIARVFSIGHTWGWDPATGKYDWPKPLWTIEISDNPGVNESEPRVYLHWHHAREWIDPAFMMYLINTLVNEYYSNDTVHWIVDHYDIFITPLSNADGYLVDGNGNPANISGGWGPGGWRKNARDLDGNGKLDIDNLWDAQGEGVDPERNWDWHWSDGNDNPSDPDYHGPAPFSEPEVRAERDFIENYSIDAQCVLHSFSAAILIPWFYTSQKAPHDSFYRDFARHMSLRTKIDGDSAQHYDYGRPDEVIGYSAPGGSSDWVYGKLNKIGIAVEMEPPYTGSGDGFHPDTSKISTYVSDLYEAMIYFIEISSTKLKPVSEAGDQPNAYIVHGHIRDENGNPVSGATVSITNSANGDEITVNTDEHGFYMANLGRMNHSYTNTTSFQIEVNGETVSFTPNSTMGSEKIDLTVHNVPELESMGASFLLLSILMVAVFRMRE